MRPAWGHPEGLAGSAQQGPEFLHHGGRGMRKENTHYVNIPRARKDWPK